MRSPNKFTRTYKPTELPTFTLPFRIIFGEKWITNKIHELMKYRIDIMKFIPNTNKVKTTTNPEYYYQVEKYGGETIKEMELDTIKEQVRITKMTKSIDIIEEYNKNRKNNVYYKINEYSLEEGIPSQIPKEIIKILKHIENSKRNMNTFNVTINKKYITKSNGIIPILNILEEVIPPENIEEIEISNKIILKTLLRDDHKNDYNVNIHITTNNINIIENNKELYKTIIENIKEKCPDETKINYFIPQNIILINTFTIQHKTTVEKFLKIKEQYHCSFCRETIINTLKDKPIIIRIYDNTVEVNNKEYKIIDLGTHKSFNKFFVMGDDYKMLITTEYGYVLKTLPKPLGQQLTKIENNNCLNSLYTKNGVLLLNCTGEYINVNNYFIDNNGNIRKY